MHYVCPEAPLLKMTMTRCIGTWCATCMPCEICMRVFRCLERKYELIQSGVYINLFFVISDYLTCMHANAQVTLSSPPYLVLRAAFQAQVP